LRNLKSLLLKVVAGVFALLLLVVVTVVLVNRKDEPVSQAALKLRHIAESSEQVADGDNAYVYLLGYSARENADVRPESFARVKWFRDFFARSGPSELSEYPGKDHVPSEASDPELKHLAALCKDDNRACADALERDPARIRTWVQRDAELIGRYEGLIEFTRWRELWPSDVRAPIPRFSQVAEGQRLMLLRAWLMAGQGDVKGCKRLLEQDLKFWRMTLGESSSLISKMIAAGAIERHFTMGNLVLRRLPPASVMAAIPENWREPMSFHETSMAKVMANEWKFSDQLIGPVAASNELQSMVWEFDSDILASGFLGRFLFQPQATSNANAERMLAVMTLFERDQKEMQSAAKEMLSTEAFAQKGITELGIYNFTGALLLNLTEPDTFVKYGFRVANLEAIRRVAFLASQLRSARIESNKVAGELQKSGIRDPFDGRPFAWESTQANLVLHRTQGGNADLKIAY